MQSGIQDPADFQHCSSQYNACTLWTVSVMKITYYQFKVAHKNQPETAVSESRWDVKFTQTATCPTKDLIANKLKNLQPYHVMFITRYVVLVRLFLVMNIALWKKQSYKNHISCFSEKIQTILHKQWCRCLLHCMKTSKKGLMASTQSTQEKLLTGK